MFGEHLIDCRLLELPTSEHLGGRTNKAPSDPDRRDAEDLEGRPDEIDPLNAGVSVGVNRVSWEERSTRRRIAVIARDEMTMQMGLLVSQDQIVHLDRAESLLNGLACAQDVSEEDPTFKRRQIVGLRDMTSADNHAVPRRELVGTQSQHACVKG